MREITDHKLNGLNEALTITALDEPGQGNACHEYEISYKEPTAGGKRDTRITFQNGPIAEAGVNGISNEALLAVIIDRLLGFQRGEFACHNNALALKDAEGCLHWLQQRTRDRTARGIEGTHRN